MFFKGNIKTQSWTSLAVQWLRLRASTAGGTGSTPGCGRSCMLCHKVKIKWNNKTTAWIVKKKSKLSTVSGFCLNNVFNVLNLSGYYLMSLWRVKVLAIISQEWCFLFFYHEKYFTAFLCFTYNEKHFIENKWKSKTMSAIQSHQEERRATSRVK